MSGKLKILFAPLFCTGHFNACIGLAEPLRDRGHTVIFAITREFQGKAAALGFTEEIIPINISEEMDQPINLNIGCDSHCQSPEEQIKSIIVPVTCVLVDFIHKSEPFFKKMLSQMNPDVIVVDNMVCYPSLITSGIPWILSLSVAPLAISENNVPPAGSGLPMNGDRAEWKRFREFNAQCMTDIFKKHNSFMIEHGAGPLQQFPEFWNFSPFANIYMYPKELDYTDVRQNPPNFHQFDTFMRMSEDTFEVPEVLRNKQGRLIYFSMGTIASVDVGLLKRLIKILEKSPNRFIVSKGSFCDDLELPANMWGARTVPQTSVIPLVDLVITHGGNNTVTETFYFGKPCIGLPLFADQYDNAQRIQELELGLRFAPYKVTETELSDGIENVLGNEELRKRMETISKRIQAANNQSRAAELIERVARKYRVSKS